jgi:zinc transporter, ZIP family
MGEAFIQGVLASTSLVIGALIAMRSPLGTRLLGVIMAFGAGVLISSVAYELVGEAFDTSAGEGGVGLGLLTGALVFSAGDAAIGRLGGARRKHSGGDQAAGSSLGIALGTVLDGIPESVVLGVGLLSGTETSIAFLLAVFISNLPEAIASTSGLLVAGWPRRRLVAMWMAISLVCGAAAALGFVAFDGASPSVLAFVLAFAGGAVLTMLADTMMPEAFEHGGKLVGLVTTAGFGTGFLLATL